MKTDRIKRFQRIVLSHYKKYGRDLPWRPPTLKLRRDKALDPYKILVSEIMLQQTQVTAVIPKYENFIKRFPTMAKLRKASSADVLKAWQGLGYNRRALALKKIAAQLDGGTIPKTAEELQQFPGVGPYTARAIVAFAYNLPAGRHGRKAVCIETNIRRVFLHHFFSGFANVSDEQLLPLIEQTLPKRDVRTWYWALMDYGSWLAKRVTNPNRRSRQYVQQSKFEGSVRQVRGAILKLLIEKKKISGRQLQSELAGDIRLRPALAGLVKDALIVQEGRYFLLAA